MIFCLADGVIFMQKRIPNKRYCPEFNKQVADTVQKENLSCRETKASCPDNAAIENFFGLLKTELLCLQESESTEHFKKELIE